MTETTAIAAAGPESSGARIELGHAPMDAIHREFYDCMDALRGPGDRAQSLLALHEHLLRHFAQEEHWMRETAFPACACHAREHEMALAVVAEVRRRHDAGDADIADRLAEELPQWFAVHAAAMDAGLAEHLRTGGAGSAAAHACTAT